MLSQSAVIFGNKLLFFNSLVNEIPGEDLSQFAVAIHIEIGIYIDILKSLIPVTPIFVDFQENFDGSLKEPQVREAHRRGRQLVLKYLAGGGEDGDADYGVQVVQPNGDYFVDVTDTGRARLGVGKLLERLQVIKSTGDATSAADLFERLGTHLDPDIHSNIRRRAARLKIPRHTAFVFPRLVPELKGGEVIDAHLLSDEDLTEQQLRFSHLRHNTSIK